MSNWGDPRPGADHVKNQDTRTDTAEDRLPPEGLAEHVFLGMSGERSALAGTGVAGMIPRRPLQYLGSWLRFAEPGLREPIESTFGQQLGQHLAQGLVSFLPENLSNTVLDLGDGLPAGFCGGPAPGGEHD